MRFPSIKTLADGFISTIKRFPFEALFALTGTIAGTIEIELRHHSRVNEGWCMRTIMVANLGFLLNLSATLYTQSVKAATRKKILVRAAAILITVLLIFIINPPLRQADYTRFFLLSLAFHLMVAFAAFTTRGQVQGFWQFNKTLFLRFLTSMLYGVVLFMGLAAAIEAMNLLFNFKFEWDTFANLWIWILGMFTTIFFLAGIPADTRMLDDDLSYPKSLKIFTQYVLIPLSTVYVLILLAYEVKILAAWTLPKGLVSNLILSYAVFGILSLLLVYPIRNQNENKWLKTYARSFYFLLIPLLGLLFVAVGARVFSYGITEYRYFLILLACWLLFISVYFLLFKKQNIKLIPISLCILTLLAIYGPQSAFSVSMYSQRRIVLDFFKKHNAFKDGRMMPVDSTKISRKEGSKAVVDLEYVIYHYDLAALQPYMNKNLEAVADSLGKLKSNRDDTFGVDRDELRGYKFEWAKKYLGLHHFERYYSSDIDRIETIYHINARGNVTEVKGYDFMVNANLNTDTVIDNNKGVVITQIQLPNKSFFLRLDEEVFKFNTAEFAKNLLADTKKIEQYRQKSAYEYNTDQDYSFPKKSLILTQHTAKYTVSLVIEYMQVNESKSKKREIQLASGTYLIKINK
jgi:hypothetical protein